MDGYIYLIESIKNGKLYFGSTNRPGIRIKEHNDKICKATRNFIPWRCLLIIKVNDLQEARKIEYYIKRYKEKLNTKNIVKILNNYFQKK